MAKSHVARIGMKYNFKEVAIERAIESGIAKELLSATEGSELVRKICQSEDGNVTVIFRQGDNKGTRLYNRMADIIEDNTLSQRIHYSEEAGVLSTVSGAFGEDMGKMAKFNKILQEAANKAFGRGISIDDGGMISR